MLSFIDSTFSNTTVLSEIVFQFPLPYLFSTPPLSAEPIMATALAMDDMYTLAIALLLPITAAILVIQDNPYYGLVLRGIVGAVAALVYALFGAADVALTEALVGTMLSITLYAIAVRSSLSMRLGILENLAEHDQQSWDRLTRALNKSLQRRHMRLEILLYPTMSALHTALDQREVHTIATVATSSQHKSDWANINHNQSNSSQSLYQLQTRVAQLHSLMSQLPEEMALSTLVMLPPEDSNQPRPTMTSIFEQPEEAQL